MAIDAQDLQVQFVLSQPHVARGNILSRDLPRQIRIVLCLGGCSVSRPAFRCSSQSLPGLLWALSYDGHNAILRTRYLPPDPSLPAHGFTPKGAQSGEAIAVIDGELLIGRSWRAVDYTARSTGWHLFTLPSENLLRKDTMLHRWGCDIFRQQNSRGRSYRILIPIWAIVLPALILPGAWYRSYARQRANRLKSGLCHYCETDVSGAVSGICPNCGTFISRADALPSTS